MNTQIADRAVVIGASIAGLLAAHVLADSYGQVTVIDRDELPETPTHRRGVPHGRHLHALAARGQQALEELLPGLTAAVVADGAPVGGPAGRRTLLPQRSPARPGTQRTDAPVRQPTTPGTPRAGQGANPPQRAIPRSLRRRRSRRAPDGSPCDRGAGAPSRRRQRRGAAATPTSSSMRPAAARAPRHGSRRSATPHPSARRCGSGWATRPGPIGWQRLPSTATWRCSSRRRRSIHGPGPCSGSRVTGGC